MQGTLIGAPGRWRIRHAYPTHDRPVMIAVDWDVTGARRTGPMAPDMAAGLAVTWKRAPTSGGTWEAYQQGDWLVIDTAPEGTIAPEEPIPPPRVRKGAEPPRYRCGRWETYTRRDGWR